MAAVWVGTSGYVYPHWRGGVFYPPTVRPRDELAWYAGQFRTVELNYPFYRSPTTATYRRWYDETPDDFVFAVKLSREISHRRRLRDAAEPLRAFLETAGALDGKLGPLLVQLPPQFSCDLPRLAAFLELLPQERRWVLETRNPSWQTPAVWELLARHQVALCVPVGGRVRPDLITTAAFSYLRMHAGRGADGRFEDDQLDEWAGRVRALARSGKEVYVYFNNDLGGHAVRDARRLLDRLPGSRQDGGSARGRRGKS
jgi:uncharacterized protein YecE (DUF72 family)